MKGIVKNLRHIRLLRHQGDSSTVRHAQRLDKTIKTLRAFLKVGNHTMEKQRVIWSRIRH